MTIQRITLRIDGTPLPAQRPRFTKGSNYMFDPQKKQKIDVRIKIMEQIEKLPKSNNYFFKNCIYFDEAAFFDVDLKFYFTPGTKFYKKILSRPMGDHIHIVKPDIDNLSKFYLDCMSGIIYKDDNNIGRLTAEKMLWNEAFTEITVTAYFPTFGPPYFRENEKVQDLLPKQVTTMIGHDFLL